MEGRAIRFSFTVENMQIFSGGGRDELKSNTEEAQVLRASTSRAILKLNSHIIIYSY